MTQVRLPPVVLHQRDRQANIRTSIAFSCPERGIDTVAIARLVPSACSPEPWWGKERSCSPAQGIVALSRPSAFCCSGYQGSKRKETRWVGRESAQAGLGLETQEGLRCSLIAVCMEQCDRCKASCSERWLHHWFLQLKIISNRPMCDSHGFTLSVTPVQMHAEPRQNVLTFDFKAKRTLAIPKRSTRSIQPQSI
jgi:hypothetical protein